MEELSVSLLKEESTPSVEKLKPTLDTFVYNFDKQLREKRKKLYNEFKDEDPTARVNQGLGRILIIAEIETIDMVRSSLVEAWKMIGGITKESTND